MMSLTPYQFEEVMGGLARVLCDEHGQEDPERKAAMQDFMEKESARNAAEVLKGRKGKISLAELLKMDPAPGR